MSNMKSAIRINNVSATTARGKKPKNPSLPRKKNVTLAKPTSVTTLYMRRLNRPSKNIRGNIPW